MVYRLLLIVIFVGLAAAAVPGQPSSTSQPAARPKTDVKEIEARKALKLKATSALSSVVTELPQVDALADRLSIAEGVVKLLAKSDADACRKILDSLYDGVQDARAARSADSRSPGPDPDRLIERVVRLAALVDPKLGESYVKRYVTANESESSAESSAERSARNPQGARLRLKMALDLLEKSPAASLSLAESSLPAGVFSDTLAFLGSLRKKDPVLANTFFRAALASVITRRGTDVNELLLLYAYVFSPQRVPIVTPQGIGLYGNAVAPESAVDPTLAHFYFDSMVPLLLDQNRLNPENVPNLANGLIGDFYVITILQPAAANYAPTTVEALSLRKTVLSGMLQPQERESSNESADRWNNIPSKANLTGDPNKTTVDYLLERAEKTANPEQKDRYYYEAAMAAAHTREYERAIKIVDKITGSYSADAKHLILFDIAYEAADQKDMEKAEFYARQDDDLTRRSFLFTVIAANSIKGATPDLKRARQFLEEVGGLASRLDKQPDKTAVLFGAVNVYSDFDPATAFQTLTSAIDSANKLESFNGDVRVPNGARIGGMLFDYSMYGYEYTFTDGVKKLANKDFDETLSHLRMIKSRVPRLRATVLLCEAVLSRNP